MNVTSTPSGLAVVGFGSPAERTPPAIPRQYFTNHCDRLEEVLRLVKFIDERRGELVSVTRHGESCVGITNENTGYLVTFMHHEYLDVERKT